MKFVRRKSPAVVIPFEKKWILFFVLRTTSYAVRSNCNCIIYSNSWNAATSGSERANIVPVIIWSSVPYDCLFLDLLFSTAHERRTSIAWNWNLKYQMAQDLNYAVSKSKYVCNLTFRLWVLEISEWHCKWLTTDNDKALRLHYAIMLFFVHAMAGTGLTKPLINQWSINNKLFWIRHMSKSLFNERYQF